jgi:hypothetical protein
MHRRAAPCDAHRSSHCASKRDGSDPQVVLGRTQKELTMSKVGRAALTALVFAFGASVTEASSITVNEITITTTLVSGAIEVELGAVPEPASLLLLGTGLALVARRMRRVAR